MPDDLQASAIPRPSTTAAAFVMQLQAPSHGQERVTSGTAAALAPPRTAAIAPTTVKLMPPAIIPPLVAQRQSGALAAVVHSVATPAIIPPLGARQQSSA